MLIVALLIIAKTWKQCKDPSMQEWIQRMWCVYVCVCLCLCVLSCFSCIWLFATLQTAAHQAPLSTEVFRNEYWSWLPCPSPGDLSDPGVESASLMPPALAGGFFTATTTWEAIHTHTHTYTHTRKYTHTHTHIGMFVYVILHCMC